MSLILGKRCSEIHIDCGILKLMCVTVTKLTFIVDNPCPELDCGAPGGTCALTTDSSGQPTGEAQCVCNDGFCGDNCQACKFLLPLYIILSDKNTKRLIWKRICMHNMSRCQYIYIWNNFQFIYIFTLSLWFLIFMPPFQKGGHIALHLSVGMSVCRSVGMSVGRYVGIS